MDSDYEVEFEVDCEVEYAQDYAEETTDDYLDCTSDDIVVAVNRNRCNDCVTKESVINHLEDDLEFLKQEHENVLGEISAKDNDIVELQTKLLVADAIKLVTQNDVSDESVAVQDSEQSVADEEEEDNHEAPERLIDMTLFAMPDSYNDYCPPKQNYRNLLDMTVMDSSMSPQLLGSQDVPQRMDDKSMQAEDFVAHADHEIIERQEEDIVELQTMLLVANAVIQNLEAEQNVIDESQRLVVEHEQANSKSLSLQLSALQSHTEKVKLDKDLIVQQLSEDNEDLCQQICNLQACVLSMNEKFDLERNSNDVQLKNFHQLEAESDQLRKSLQNAEEDKLQLIQQFDLEKDGLAKKITELQLSSKLLEEKLESEKCESDLESKAEAEQLRALIAYTENEKLRMIEQFDAEREGLVNKIAELELHSQLLDEKLSSEKEVFDFGLNNVTLLEKESDKVEELNCEIRKLTNRLETVENEKAMLSVELERGDNGNQDRIEELELQVQTMEEKLAAQVDAHQFEFQNMLVSNEKSLKKIQALDAELDRLVKQIEMLTAEKTEISTRVDSEKVELVATIKFLEDEKTAITEDFVAKDMENKAVVVELEKQKEKDSETILKISSECSQLKSLFESFESEKNQLVERFEAEKNSFLQNILSLEREKASLAEKFENDRNAYEAKLEHYESELDDMANELELQIKINKKKSEKFEHEKATLTASLNDLESDNSDASVKVEKLKTEIQRHIYDKKKLEDEVEDVRSKFLEQIAELDAEKECMKEQLTREAYDYEERIDELKSELEKFQNEQTKRPHVSLNEMEKENEVLKQKISKLELTNHDLAERHDTEKFCYEEKLAHYESVLERTTLEVDIDVLKDSIRRREAEVAELNVQVSSGNSEKKMMAAEVEKVRAKYDTILEKFKAIESENGLLRDRLEQLNDQADKVAALERKIRDFEMDRKSKNHKLDFALKQARKWEQAMNEAAKEKEQLEKVLAELKTTNTQLANEVALYSEQFALARSELEKSRKSISYRRNDLSMDRSPATGDMTRLASKMRQVKLSDDEADLTSLEDNERVQGDENVETKRGPQVASPQKRNPLTPRQMAP
ncbi:hypothetical protein HDE_06054 [Halotydeus destructor]|nr:hypothetical protein HDE_06054 [Halotydeus destructor]